MRVLCIGRRLGLRRVLTQSLLQQEFPSRLLFQEKEQIVTHLFSNLLRNFLQGLFQVAGVEQKRTALENPPFGKIAKFCVDQNT